jgi:hypothetical protein
LNNTLIRLSSGWNPYVASGETRVKLILQKCSTFAKVCYSRLHKEHRAQRGE